MGGGGAHILGSPMLFVPFTVPTFPATHHQTTHPAHQTHHQQLQATTQNPVQQPQQLTQLNQLSHLNHQGIVPATTNQPTIHSTSCSPQQQATTPNKVKQKKKVKKKKKKKKKKKTKSNVLHHFLMIFSPTTPVVRMHDSIRPNDAEKALKEPCFSAYLAGTIPANAIRICRSVHYSSKRIRLQHAYTDIYFDSFLYDNYTNF